MKHNKIFIIAFAVLLVISIGTSFYDGINTSIDIPYVPELSIGGRELPKLQSYKTIDSPAISRELKDIFPDISSSDINMADRKFEIPRHESMLEMIEWMAHFYWSTPYMRYTPEAYDCDNFARTFVVFSDLASREGFNGGQTTLFRIYTKQEYTWGGVPSGGYHALVVFRSNRGWFVYEPQGRSIVSAREYPNRKYVLKVIGD